MVPRQFFYTSDYANLEEVKKKFKLPKKMFLTDCVLREADQVVNMNFDEKIKIAHALDEFGMHQIEIGMPGVNPQDREVATRIRKEKLNAKLQVISCVYVANWKADLDACIDTEPDTINVIHPASKVKLDVMGISEEKMIDTCVDAIRYAKEKGVKNIAFSPFDTTRTDLKVLKKIIPLVAKAGGSTIYICDTYGVMLPSAMKYLVKSVSKMAGNIRIGVHCHNDMGLSLANTLAAVEEGAEVIDTTTNGVGDRTGNCPMEELTISLMAFYGFDLGFKLDKLRLVSKLVEEMSGIKVPLSKPIVGDNAFAHRHDDDVKSSLTIPASTVPLEPKLVGNTRKVLVGGKYSGPYTIGAKAEELGLKLDDEQVKRVLEQIRAKILGKKTSMTDDEFLEIARKA